MATTVGARSRAKAENVQGNQQRDNWRREYAYRLVFTDLLALFWAVNGAAFLTVSLDEPLVTPAWLRGLKLNYAGVVVLLIGSWAVALAGLGSRGHRVIGTGSSEYKAVLRSGIVVLLCIGLATFAFQIQVSRGFILVALPVGVSALLVSRLLWRQWLRLHRQRGLFCSRALIVGSINTTSHIVQDLRRHPAAGYNVVGAVVTSGWGTPSFQDDILVYFDIDLLLHAVSECRADTVIITDGHNLEPAKLRELSWSLEPGRQHLVMAPSLTDIAGPRIHARPVAGLPLVHVETPRYEGADRFAKRAFDMCASAALLFLLSLPLVMVAVLVILTSRGPVFFAHERIGKHGRPFRMLKFRSMVPDADAKLEHLLEAQGTTQQPLFKIKNDPRITRVGRYLRRYSIDELPQLINVVRGDMSLVGPRPQVAREVALYDHAAARRLFVKPGMTGLWQVSGRSNLGWEESVRLDLFYVENWSLTADIAILLRTMRAVLTSAGAE